MGFYLFASQIFIPEFIDPKEFLRAHLKDVDTFVTDKKPSKEIVGICKKNNVELIISPPNS